MNQSETQDQQTKVFLGVDGGQSHTEAVVADEFGHILGFGFGGPSNHAEIPGGRERLRSAVLDSVSVALGGSAGVDAIETEFAGAYFGMTGGADFKEEIISGLISASKLTVDNDAPTALASGSFGAPGVVVICGTGSAIYGEDAEGGKARAGGLGYLFSDEGSGFWLAAQTIRLAIREQDGVIPKHGLESLVLEFFAVDQIRDLTTPFYNGLISRDRIASFARKVQETAEAGNEVLIQQIEFGAECLVENVCAVLTRLQMPEKFNVVTVGGMFDGSLLNSAFSQRVAKKIPAAHIVRPRFRPAVGALLLAYRSANIEVSEQLLLNLEESQVK